jgi:hypothetical protein
MSGDINHLGGIVLDAGIHLDKLRMVCTPAAAIPEWDFHQDAGAATHHHFASHDPRRSH